MTPRQNASRSRPSDVSPGLLGRVGAGLEDHELDLWIDEDGLPVHPEHREARALARIQPELVPVAHERRGLARPELLGHAAGIGGVEQIVAGDHLPAGWLVGAYAVVG